MTNLTNFHSITIKYLPATNTRGSRIKLISTRFKCSIVLNYDYQIGDITAQAANWLTAKGFNVVGACEDGKMIITSTFDAFN